MNINNIKKLAEAHSSKELDQFVEDHIQNKTNACFIGDDDTDTVNTLAKASYIKKLVEEGKCENLTAAIRQLAGQMRKLQEHQ